MFSPTIYTSALSLAGAHTQLSHLVKQTKADLLLYVTMTPPKYGKGHFATSHLK